MRTGWLGVGLILCAVSALGAVRYEFHHVNRSDSDSLSTTEFAARATIDGESSKVEFLSGNAYPPGTYVISTNGSRTLTFVDPTQKSYTEINTSTVAAAIGTSKIKIENRKTELTKLEDHQIVADIPTDHYRLAISYDITITFGSMPLKQNVRTIIDKWTTVRFGDIAESYVTSSGVRTGNEDLDKILDDETTRIKGFPLRQTVEIVTTNLQPMVNGSKLGMSPTRTQKREIMVTSIKSVPSNPASFAIPLAYHRTEPGTTDAQRPGVQILSLEPASK